MAEYTVELRTIVDHGINIFDFRYPFYDESKRLDFEESFIRHFYFREIGCETVDRFKHYLKDKMLTVFPYYNSLFEASKIEYNILDNYNIKEEYTIKRENTGKTNGVSYTVDQVRNKQASQTDEESNTDTLSTTRNEGTRTEKETVDNDTTKNMQQEETIDNLVTGSVESESEKTTNLDRETTSFNRKKFLDTPQGLLDLSEANYLTELTEDDGNGTETVSTTETASGKEDKSETTNTARHNSVTESGTADTERNLTGNTEENGTANGNEKSTGKTSSNIEGEQTATQDNNTRTEMVGNQTETSVFTKKGNIGVDTDADMIQKHIKLQQILRKIELMFFDECEDLFMLVY